MSESPQTSWITAVLQTRRVPLRQRSVLSGALGLMAGWMTVLENIRTIGHRDFGQVWFAARAILHGSDPYSLIGVGREFSWPWPFIYPLPAAVAAIPLAPFTEHAATVIFSVCAGAAFAWALMEFGYAPLFGFFGASMRYAAGNVQFSPLMAASVVIPPLAFFLVAKPTIGLAMFAARPSWWAIAGALALGGTAFAVDPQWVQTWLGVVEANGRTFAPVEPYRPPILYPGGVVALLCLARWRRPEARLVAVLACVPQTAVLYETVPLFLVPRTFPETALLVALSYVQFYVVAAVPVSDWGSQTVLSGQATAILMYMPATAMILRRPNEGKLSPWLERQVPYLPSWLRGAPSSAATAFLQWAARGGT